MTDLDWLATNVHEWPIEYHDLMRGDFVTGYWNSGWKRINGFTKDQWQQRRKELQSKPSWDDAPEWAHWLAQDECGDWWFFFSCSSKTEKDYWNIYSCSGKMSAGSSGQVLGDWCDTLEQRPKEEFMKEFKPTHIVNDIPCTIAYQSEWVIVITTETGQDIAFGTVNTTIKPYKAKREQKIEELIDLWRRQSLDGAHDNENSTVKLGRAIEWFVDNYLDEGS